ncbi:MAG: MetS family NSS transporter small subunit [Streptosporangiales bacterium]|nr:MetS family NSS transporter small subunit [Streptosporangiales bacterium]
MGTSAIVMLLIGVVVVYGSLTAAVVNYIRASRKDVS